jgi:hypothetical protein
MADNIFYRQAWVETSIKDGVLDLPFPVYAQQVYLDGVDISFSLAAHEGNDVLASVDYMIDHPVLKRNDTELVEGSGKKVKDGDEKKSKHFPKVVEVADEQSV